MKTIKDIIKENLQLGIDTKIFNSDNGILGYTENGVIYLNEYYQNDLEITNRHEILHLYEDSKQFKAIKSMILKIYRDELESLRQEYYLKYNLLYSKEDIDNGVLDNEIVIDIIIGNGKYNNDINLYIKNPYETIIKEKESINLTSQSKKFLLLNASSNDQKRYHSLSNWDKIFAYNYYEKRDKPSKNSMVEIIKQDAKKAYIELANLSKEYFTITPENNPDLERRLQEIIDNYRRMGKENIAINMIKNYNQELIYLAEKYSDSLYKEYRDIIMQLEDGNYDDTFKYLILNETLNKVYRKEKGHRVVDTRVAHKTIASHMNFNRYILDEIYKSAPQSSRFADSYFQALEVYRTQISKKDSLGIEDQENVIGYWKKFGGRRSIREYEEDLKNLLVLVSDTPWCTKKDPAFWLQPGYEFYIFLDLNGKPHLAASIENDTLREIRGIKGNEAQEIEQEYRGEALLFLKENLHLLNANLWLEKELRNDRLYDNLMSLKRHNLSDRDFQEMVSDLNKYELFVHAGLINSAESEILDIISEDEALQQKIISNLNPKDKLYKFIKKAQWNKRILKYIEKIRNNTLEESEYRSVLADISIEYDDYICIENLNNLITLINTTNNKFKKDIAESQFRCSPNDIYIGNIDLSTLTTITRNNILPYRYVIGNINAQNLENYDFQNLRYISGDLNLHNSKNIKALNLLEIGGNLNIIDTNNILLSSLIYINGDLEALNSSADMSSLRIIVGNADFNLSSIEKLNNLATVKGDLHLNNHTVFRSLKIVEGTIYFNSNLSKQEHLPNLVQFGRCENTPEEFQSLFSYNKNENIFKINNRRI